MRYPVSWLLDWIAISDIPLPELAERLVFAGFELESLHEGPLDEALLDLKVTANRGDALSMLGLARDIAALYDRPCHDKLPEARTPTGVCPVALEASCCPVFHAALITLPEPAKRNPDWLVRRLTQAGMLSVHPMVDLLNHMMLGCGQPMHAYDADRIQGTLCVRESQEGELFETLQGQTLTLRAGHCVVADEVGVLALGGVIGGARAAVRPESTRILLEAAHFTPESIATTRRYNLHTEAAFRFARGVDPSLPGPALSAVLDQCQALHQAVCHAISVSGRVDPPTPLLLPHSAPQRYLGYAPDHHRVHTLFERLGAQVHNLSDHWHITPPSHRMDWQEEVDLIEEIARLIGYEHLPEEAPCLPMLPAPPSRQQLHIDQLQHHMAAQGFSQSIHYHFVDREQETFWGSLSHALAVRNPISEDKAVMRTQLLGSLLRTMVAHHNRQQHDVRLFELGTCYQGPQLPPTETQHWAFVMVGSRHPVQWGLPECALDFFDAKGVVTQIADVLRVPVSWEGLPEPAMTEQPPLWHPQHSAVVRHTTTQKPLGTVGALHPHWVQVLGLKAAPWLFEGSLAPWCVPQHAGIVVPERSPCMTRDLALWVPRTCAYAALQAAVTNEAPEWLKEVRLFDVFDSKNAPEGMIGMAVRLSAQAKERTLEDKDVDAMVAAVLQRLAKLGVVLRR